MPFQKNSIHPIVEWSIAVTISMIYNTNKSGPRTEPWGAPSSTCLNADKTPLNPVF
jgi:hypothetical protein